jgi:3-methyladenine DNA glycosylase AlkD
MVTKGAGMNVEEILATFQTLGKAQTAAIYKRHGAGDNVYGVLTAEITKLKKKIKVKHALALELWKTGNAEARILALLIADPAQLSRADADALIQAGPVRFLGGYLADLLARSALADETMRAWMQSKEECYREVGYGILGARLRDDPESISDADAKQILATIEQEIHGSPNWARYAMNNALIAIGVFKPTLHEAAIEAAARVGKVAVDHGETACKTPDAISYIEKAAKRRRSP